MDRQDREAAKTGFVPEYQRTGTVDMFGGSGSGSSTKSNSNNSYKGYSGSRSTRN